MSAAAAGRRSLLTALVGYLVEPDERSPVEPGEGSAVGHGWVRETLSRPVVAVVGARAACGTTTVARALGVELALCHPEGACAVTAERMPTGGLILGSAAAGRLARGLTRRVPGSLRASGRLCLVDADRVSLAEAARDLAPIVIDVEDPEDAPIAVSLADVVVIVATADVEPALTDLLAASLARVGPRPLIVLNRAGAADGRWGGRCDLTVPESRIGARLALGGREARGPLGIAVRRLVELVEDRS